MYIFGCCFEMDGYVLRRKVDSLTDQLNKMDEKIYSLKTGCSTGCIPPPKFALIWKH